MLLAEIPSFGPFSATTASRLSMVEIARAIAGVNDPKHIHLVAYKFGIGFGHHQVKKRAVLVRLKFITVRVGKKLQTLLRQRFARLIENRNGGAAGFFVELRAVWNPGAADVLQAEDFRVMNYAIQIGAELIEWKMRADGLETARVQQRFELFRREVISPG